MSASAYAICPKCKTVQPECEPGDEYAGTLNIHTEFWNITEDGTNDFRFKVSFNCGAPDCDFTAELTQENLPDMLTIQPHRSEQGAS